MEVAGRHGRVARRARHAVLDEAPVELGGLQLRRPASEERLERFAHLVGLLADRPALLGGSSPIERSAWVKPDLYQVADP